MPLELEPSPIIVFGAARSGTTYLINILNQQPQFFISDETRIFVWAHHALTQLPQQEPIFFRHRDEFVHYLWDVSPQVIRSFYRRLHPRARYWGDKNPHYVSPDNRGCLDTIERLFPGTRYLHIIRDGRDVISSGLRGVWTDFDAVHAMWTSHVDCGCEFGRALPKDRYFELRYEDLVRDDVAVARQVFNFLGVEISAAVVEFCERQRARRTPYCRPSRNLAAGVTASDWASILSPAQQLRSLGLLAAHLVRYGYENETSFTNLYRNVAELHAADLLKSFGTVVREVAPENASVLVVSKGDDRLLELDGRRGQHFPQDGTGGYLGYHPASDAEAIEMLETRRARGAEYLAFPDTAFWWLDYYRGFAAHLRSQYRCARETPRVVVFALSSPPSIANDRSPLPLARTET